MLYFIGYAMFISVITVCPPLSVNILGRTSKQHFVILISYHWGQEVYNDRSSSLCFGSLVPRPFVGEMAWQLTRVQTVYGYDVKEILQFHPYKQ